MKTHAAPLISPIALRARVDWLGRLKPTDSVESIVDALQRGAPEDELWAAGALTAARRLNNQARNLLGFVSHAMIGCEDARRLATGQPTSTRHLLLVQALHQVVRDLHDPCFAPSSLPEFWPEREHDLDASLRALRSDVRFGEYMRADHRLSALVEDMPRAALIDLLLDIGLEGMVTDDHTLLTPWLCLGMIELIGWRRGLIMLRWALRYSASFPRDFRPYDRALALRASYNLDSGAPNEHLQQRRVAPLRAVLLAAEPSDRPEIVARAMGVEGYAPATVLAAVSLAACDMYLMTEPVPHADEDAVSREVAPIHIGTSTSALRCALPRMRPHTRALAAIMGGSLLERGPSVLNRDFAFVDFVPGTPYPLVEDVARLRAQTPERLLALLAESLPAHDYRAATAAVRAYADAGGAPEPLITLLTNVACTDDLTLLHSFKHLHAMVVEFEHCGLPDRWGFLIAAARFAAWYAGLATDAHRRAEHALAAHLRARAVAAG